MDKKKTLIVPIDIWHELADDAAARVREGGMVLFPTETVYGIGALPVEENLQKIIAMKLRPQGKAFQLLISSPEMLDEFGAVVSPLARKMIDIFWPGPLTLVLEVKSDRLPDALIHNGSTGFRMPAHDVCRDMILRCGGALAATSANLSDGPVAKSCVEALRTFAGKIDVAIDAGTLDESLPSTVASVRNGDIIVLRKGAINESLLIDVAEN
jgi:L-threonylcarbamoyladenylate synthase